MSIHKNTFIRGLIITIIFTILYSLGYSQSCNSHEFLKTPETNFHKHIYRKTIDDNKLVWLKEDSTFQYSDIEKYYQTARSYYMLGLTDSALFVFKKASRLSLVNNYQKENVRLDDFMSMIYFDKGYYDSAIFYVNREFKYYKEYEDTRGVILCLCKQIKNYLFKNEFGNASLQIQQLLEQANNSNDSISKALVYATIADYYYKTQNYPSAKKYYTKSIEIYENFKQENKNLHCERLVNLSITELNLGNKSSAIQLANEAIQIANQLQIHHQKALGYIALGRVYLKSNLIDSAICMYTTALATGCSNCPDMKFFEHIIELGKLYMLRAEIGNANKVFSASLNIALIANSPTLIAKSYYYLGLAQNADGQLRKSLQCFHKSYDISNKYSFIQLKHNNLKKLVDYYTEQKRYAEASAYKDTLITLHEILAEKNDVVSKSEIEFRITLDDYIHQKEQAWIIKDNYSRAVIEKNKYIRNITITIASLLMVLALIVLYNYKRKSRINKELIKQKLEIERFSKQLDEANRSKLRFFTNLSHEIRTPLNLIMLSAEKLLSNKKNSYYFHKSLKSISNNSIKINELLKQIIALRKNDEKSLIINKDKKDIVELSFNIVNNLKNYCDKTACSLSAVSNYSSVIAIFDESKFHSILYNLLSNAFKYNNPNGKVSLELKFLKDEVCLIVSDTGIGISEEHQKKVFQRFYKVQSEENEIDGIGIGLAFVYEIIKVLNGKIKLSSIIGKGTAITVHLPITIIEKGICEETKINVLPSIKESAANIIEKDSLSIFKSSLLIVEDNLDLLEELKQLFNDTYIVYTASDGNKGLTSAFEIIPDMIISDVMMPKLDGNSFCKTIKNDVRTSHIPLILLTAKDLTHHKKEGYLSGADDYIIKPFSTDILKQKISNVLKTHEKHKQKVILSSNEFIENSELSVIDKDFIKQCTIVIEREINNSKFTVEMLAASMGFSQRNFYRKINSLLNITPAGFIKTIKLNHAKKLILNSSYGVAEIAANVGYESSNRFSQAFKKQFGVAPSQYKEKKR